MQDEEYRSFNAKLIPTVPPQKIIGVRTPSLRAFARKLYKSENYTDFLSQLPHEYYEENNLHASLIEQINDYDTCIDALEHFLPYVDNWATCDLMSPKIFLKNTEKLYDQIKIWICSENTYTVRFAVKTLMSVYSRENFDIEHLYLVASVDTSEYYIKMAMAWYYATVLVFHYEEVYGFLKDNHLDKWIHNKTIQKVKESFRINDEHKQELNNIKIRD